MGFDGVANVYIVYENGDRCLYIDGERRDYDDVLKLDDIDGIDDYYIDDRLFNGNNLFKIDLIGGIMDSLSENKPLIVDGLKHTGLAASYYTTDEEHIVVVALTPGLVKKIETLYRNNELICKIDFYNIDPDADKKIGNIADRQIPFNDWHIEFKIINTDIFNGEPQVDYDNGLLYFHYILKDEYIFKPLKVRGL